MEDNVLVRRLTGRAAFLQRQKKVKDPELLLSAANEIRFLRRAVEIVLEDTEGDLDFVQFRIRQLMAAK